MTEVEKLDLRSHGIAADKVSELLCLFPEIRTEGDRINFNRHFYKPRPLEEIDADLKKAEEEILRLLREVTA